jgi:cellobiose phosphorylase
MVGSVEGILGMRPDLTGLKLAPAIPSEWEKYEVEKTFRGKKLHMVFENPEGKESGFTSLSVNGEALADNYIPFDILKDENDIVYTF